MSTDQLQDPHAETAAEQPAARRGPLGAVFRWLPAGAALALFYGALLASHTSPLDIAKYTFYAVWAVLLPGTLVYRSLRRTPHTLIEDLALGAVTGLALELAAWALFTGLGVQSAAIVWPLAVVLPFALVPRLRRHWRPRDYTARPSLGWSWAVAGTVASTTAYIYRVFMDMYPVLPPDDRTRQFVDLPYLLSLAGNAKHNVPLTLPQVSGEPLAYHWFAFAHMAMTSSIGHIDLPVVEMRLMVPGLCALLMVVAAVVAWRVTDRAWAGPVAGLLLFAIGEFNAAGSPRLPFGSATTSVMIWASLSLTYCQPLLLALIAAVGDGLIGRKDGTRRVPAWGRGGRYALIALFAFASSAAKATSLPVTLAAVAFAGVIMLIRDRRIPWDVVGTGAVVVAAQFFSTAVIFNFQSYGLGVHPLVNLSGYWADPQNQRGQVSQAFVIASVWVAFLLNSQLRVAGALPLMWRRKLRLEPVQWMLLGGAIAGPAVFLMLNGWNSSYFTHAGLPFGVLLSAWGYCEAFERARLSRAAKAVLAVVSLAGVAALTALLHYGEHRWRETVENLLWGNHEWHTYGELVPMLGLAAALAAVVLVGGLLWWLASRRFEGLRKRGGIVVLTGALLLGTPTLMIDVITPYSGLASFGAVPLPASRVDAARWVRDHSNPDDVLLTNSHCTTPDYFREPDKVCDVMDMQSFWLSGYSERSVLIEGWIFAPRLQGADLTFWDQDLLAMNEQAVKAPTAPLLQRLSAEHHVRFVVVDRHIGQESPELASLAEKVYDTGKMAVYKLR
ncbi:hypothetical protein ACFVUN_16955 [Kitasatospora griseola]|uniref:hypothetical protein n=1 Tax=Kitasatospora griseola TaxID=2064 RepID=UPI0036DD927A